MSRYDHIYEHSIQSGNLIWIFVFRAHLSWICEDEKLEKPLHV